jgi:hypothetical protein
MKKLCQRCIYNNPDTGGEVGCAVNPLYWQHRRPVGRCNDFCPTPWSRDRVRYALVKRLANGVNTLPFPLLFGLNLIFIPLIICHLLAAENPYPTLKLLVFAFICLAAIDRLETYAIRLDWWIIKKYPNRLNDRQKERKEVERLERYFLCWHYLDKLEIPDNFRDSIKDKVYTLNLDGLLALTVAVAKQHITNLDDLYQWFEKFPTPPMTL